MRKRKVAKFLLKTMIAVLLIIMCVFIYLGQYSHSEASIGQYLESSEIVNVTKIDKGYFFDGPGEESAMIFYPGARVEATAYARMLYNIAEKGVDCFLVEMPLNIAFFGVNSATEIVNQYNYQYYYLCGHSMGGAVASIYASKNEDKIDGLILLAAYPTKELPENLKVLSIYGSEDGVLDMEKYENGKKYWNKNTTEVCINGANHSQYGNYGKQAKDKEALITSKDQQNKTVRLITEFIQ